MPHATKQNKGPSTSMLTEEEASHDESSHEARVTSNPSTSVLNETKGEASQDESSTQEESELGQEVYINHTRPHAPQQVYTNMYMPYIEGPKMDWMVNDTLYHRFLKWKLKCENILELTALPEWQKSKKVIVWSSNFGMDQYVSWGLSKEDTNLDTIWERFEDFCIPQSNEVHVRFDLLTSFHQGKKSVDEWYNAVQAQAKLANIHPKLQKFYIMTYFGSSYMMKILCQGPLWKEVST